MSFNVLLISLFTALLTALFLVPHDEVRRKKAVAFIIEKRTQPQQPDQTSPKILPPGPAGLPLLGNVFEFSKMLTEPDTFLRQITEKYGRMVMLRLGTSPVLVINDPKVAKDLLDKRGAIYSTRPTHRDYFQSWRLLTLPTGDLFRRLRRLYQALLSKEQSLQMRQYQDFESRVLLQDLLDKPSYFLDHVQRYTTSVIFSACYGVRLSRFDHPVAREFYTIWKRMTRYFAPGTLPIDFLPILMRLPKPLQIWITFANYLRRHEDKLHMAFFRTVKARMAAGSAPNAFGASLLTMQEAEGIKDTQACEIMSNLLGAGTDTTACFLQLFFKVMALHPTAVSAAQNELDSVVGPSRLPTWEDHASLPYIRALIKEIHRWAPSGSISIAHATTQDDNYEGIHIPRGTIIFPNLTSLSRNAEVYPNPDEFDPTRFLHHSHDLTSYAAAVHPSPSQRDHYHYGFGRRLCPGIWVAEASIFIVVSRILWAFDIKPVSGGVGPGPSRSKPEGLLCGGLDMNERIVGLVRKPLPYQVSITPRSEGCKRVVGGCMEGLSSELLDFDDVDMEGL